MHVHELEPSVISFPKQLNWQPFEVTSLVDIEEGTIFRAEIFQEESCGASWMLCAYKDDTATILTSGSSSSLRAAKEEIWQELRSRVSKASLRDFIR